MKVVFVLGLIVAGVSAQSGSGTSTRYWDCCKPSCAWGDKADWRTHSVDTCASDGTTVVSNNDRNACDSGGTAYMCTNQQPWAVDSSLAYGFAAVALSGYSERDFCCACYELTFTSTAASGQRMIVQVTNTGGDLGGNQFDIEIPGGGVGIFNGCQTQWGAPAEGWGARYGGVSSRSECDQLPTQIRSGCQWRFDWFKGADNPSFTFRRVACPSAITSRTGCIRSDESMFK